MTEYLWPVPDPRLPVSELRMMRYSIEHDVSYLAVVDYVTEHGRLPDDPTQLDPRAVTA